MARVKKVKPPKPVNLEHELCKLIVSKAVNPPINWAREIKFAQVICKFFPNKADWENYHETFKVESLLVFSTEKGRFVLQKKIEESNRQKKLNSLELPKTAIIETSKDKVGEDKVFAPSTKTLMDFLRN
jgi:hypothetical protein